MVEKNGIPVGVAIDAANVPETALGPAALAMMVVVMTVMLVPVLADKAYDSDFLREYLLTRGFFLVAPHRRNRTKPPRIDGRHLRRYRRRYVVERTFAWLHSYRRVSNRYEKKMDRYEGFVYLACAFIGLGKIVNIVVKE